MPKKTTQTERRSSAVQTEPHKSRFLPLTAAALICMITSVSLGSGAWYLFGSDKKKEAERAAITENVDSAAPMETPAIPTPAMPSADSETKPPAADQSEIKGVVAVKGGEIALGGDEKRPWQRLIVKDFAIAETEVTTAQYAEFVKETARAAPPGWNKGAIPDGTENYPVTDVSWNDAVAFCQWLAKKLDAEVRLPTEAEWELAAAGRDGKKYPWGDEWNSEAGISQESGGKISAVKSFALNRSAAGAYDMIGNVWEWTQDKVTDQTGATDDTVEQALKSGRVLRVVKGGSAQEKAAQISAQARYEIPVTTKVPTVGFRYVIVPRQ